MAAATTTAVPIQPSALSPSGRTNSPITRALLAIRTVMAMTGAALTPLITALQMLLPWLRQDAQRVDVHPPRGAIASVGVR